MLEIMFTIFDNCLEQTQETYNTGDGVARSKNENIYHWEILDADSIISIACNGYYSSKFEERITLYIKWI